MKNLILCVTTMIACLESIDLTRCFHVTRAFENKPDGTRLVSITLRVWFQIKSATLSPCGNKVSAW